MAWHRPTGSFLGPWGDFTTLSIGNTPRISKPGHHPCPGCLLPHPLVPLSLSLSLSLFPLSLSLSCSFSHFPSLCLSSTPFLSLSLSLLPFCPLSWPLHLSLAHNSTLKAGEWPKNQAPNGLAPAPSLSPRSSSSPFLPSYGSPGGICSLYLSLRLWRGQGGLSPLGKGRSCFPISICSPPPRCLR